jgi:tripartite-type tricarboxylate transporter receptor subunit TctC
MARTGGSRRIRGGMRSGLFAATLIALWGATVAAAEPYPSRPVRIILPFGAGGVADITTRVVADKLGKRLGQRFVVENQPGAGGVVAARSVLSSPADGYTLALLSNANAISVSLFKSLPFDPVKDFAPISTLGFFDFVVATAASSPLRTMADLVRTARERGLAFNVGTVSVGSSQNLSAQLLKSAARIDFTVVPFRSTPDVLVALLRDDVQVIIDTYAALKSALADGKIRALATSGPTRSGSLPTVPTAREGGIADYEVTSWNALAAPAGTPPEVIEQLSRTLREILAEPEVKKRMLDLGIEAKAGVPAEFQARLKADIEKWSRVIERAGIEKQ